MISEEELKKLRRLGIVNENALRNLWAEKELNRRRKLGEKYDDVMFDLAERLNVTPEALHSGIYRLKKRREGGGYTAPIKEI